MAGKSSFFCCVGTTVGFVSGRKIIVFLLRRNNCRVCKWQENRCFSVATIGFVSGRKLQRSQGKLWWPQRKLRRPQGKLQRPETERDIYDRGSCPRAQSRRLPELPFAHLHPSIVPQLLWWGFSRLRIINLSVLTLPPPSSSPHLRFASLL